MVLSTDSKKILYLKAATVVTMMEIKCYASIVVLQSTSLRMPHDVSITYHGVTVGS